MKIKNAMEKVKKQEQSELIKSKNITKKIQKQEQTELIKSKNKLENIKNYYIIQMIFDYMTERKPLEIIKINKYLQNRLKIDIEHYKKYFKEHSSTELEIISVENEYGGFIYIQKQKDKKYYHIYFNNNKEEEIKRTYIGYNEKVSKINIIIDFNVTSFYHLFLDCKIIKYLNFKQMKINKIIDMSGYEWYVR